MVSSAYHKRCGEHMNLVVKRIEELKFKEAARELLIADKLAIHAIDMYECERLRDQLIVRHGFDWGAFISGHNNLKNG